MIRFAMPFADDCFVYHDGSPDYYDDIVDKTEFRPDSENIPRRSCRFHRRNTACFHSRSARKYPA